MLNKKKRAACAAILLAASSVFCACAQTKQDTAAISNNETTTEKSAETVIEEDMSEDNEKVSFNTDVKDATEFTAEANNAVYELLDFSDEQEREFAQKGFLSAPDNLVIKSQDGTIVWSQDAYSFAKDNDAPDSANPSLWRNTQLNALYGLFEVTDGIYQVRGYDIANLTFVRGDERVKKTGHLRPGIVRRNHVGEQVAPLRMHARRGLSIGDNVVYTTQKMNYGRRARQCPEHIFEAARQIIGKISESPVATFREIVGVDNSQPYRRLDRKSVV